MSKIHSDLLRKFTDLAFEKAPQIRWQESQRTEAEILGAERMTEADVQGGLFAPSKNPPLTSKTLRQRAESGGNFDLTGLWNED